MLPNFLELSIGSHNLLRDLAALEELAFQPLQVNEIWMHQYGVVGDGDLQIGLHGRNLDVPRLTFVLPELAAHIPVLQDHGIDFDFIEISEQRFHQAGFTDAGGQQVWLLEARTFSPTLPNDGQTSLLGRFHEILLPARDGNHDQWAALGLIEPPSRSMPVTLHEDCTRLTIVYATGLEALIVRSARQGWTNLSVTAANEAIIKTAHDFDFLIRDITHE